MYHNQMNKTQNFLKIIRRPVRKHLDEAFNPKNTAPKAKHGGCSIIFWMNAFIYLFKSL